MTPLDSHSWHLCNDVLERLYEFLNRRELAPEDEEEIRRHLKACPPCGDRFDFEELLVTRLRKADPCECPDRLRSRVRNLLDLG